MEDAHVLFFSTSYRLWRSECLDAPVKGIRATSIPCLVRIKLTSVSICVCVCHVGVDRVGHVKTCRVWENSRVSVSIYV